MTESLEEALRQAPSWWDSQSAGESALPHPMLRPATAHQLQSNRPEPDLQGRRDHVNCSAYKNGVDANQCMISDHTKMTDNRILDDKTGRLIRYATLSLLYLVQVRAFVILKKKWLVI